MTKFNPENKETLTHDECLSPAMEITEPKDAEQYLNDYISFIQKYLDKEPTKNNNSAEEIAKANLGYYAGYYSNKTRERVEKLFKCAHPIFGSIEENGAPTPKQAYEMGKNIKK